jgi:error-prone DNA polymerase
MRFLRDHYASKTFITAEHLQSARNGKRVSIAGLVLIRQRPGSAKGVVFLTIEDETGVANLVVWPDVFEKQRKIVMGARLIAVHGIIQRDEADGVIHVIARRLEDHSHMLHRLSDDALPSTLAQGDAPGAMRPPPARHPRDAEIIPKSRDFH